MRIVHVSDLHFGAWTRDWTALLDKRLAGLLNFFLRRRPRLHYEYLQRAAYRIRALKPDWVVVTGDLTCIGSPEEFNGITSLLAPLVASSGSKFIYVPGNHDCYVRNRACAQALRETFHHLNQNRWELADLPQVVEDRGLRFFVVNECLPTAPWASSGAMVRDQMDQLLRWFREPRQDGEKRILVGHFPLRKADGRPLEWRRRLHGAESLQAALAAGQIDLALCGHDHEPFVRGEANHAVEICAGALTVWGRINVIDYSPLSSRFSQSWDDLVGNDSDIVPVGAGL